VSFGSVADLFFRLSSEVEIVVSELSPADVAGLDATLERMSICSTLTGRRRIAATINGVEVGTCLLSLHRKAVQRACVRQRWAPQRLEDLHWVFSMSQT
jgi:hypothetical protein